MVAKPDVGTIPDTPGSYQFYDSSGNIIYVGKAKSLRSRVNSYFQSQHRMHIRTAQMVQTAAKVEWIQVDTDVEALMLEFNLIKKHRPRFNVRLVDDKSYPFLALSVSDKWPRARVMRGKKRKGTTYFGPYAHAYAIRSTLDLLLRSFPIRSCSDSKLKRHEKMGKPCLLYHIEKCSGPCIGEVTEAEYGNYVEDLSSFLQGKTKPVLVSLKSQMTEAADNYEFERAAQLRDRLSSVEKSIEKQQMVVANKEDADVIGICEDELEAVVYILFVRSGTVVGQRHFVVDKVEDISQSTLIEKVIEGLYDDDPTSGMPKLIVVPYLPADNELYELWLAELRGSNVEIRVPQRGPKVELMAMAEQNAKEQFRRHRMKRQSDHNSRSKALNELQDHLGLKHSPLRIECYDMSHISGTNYVGSMVVVEDGLANTSQYRRFKINEVDQNDDYAAMEEVLTRRFTSYIKSKDLPAGEKGKFSYPPNLLVVDGGKGQLGVAVKVLEELGLVDEIEVCSLAKAFEEVFLPYKSDPIIIPRQSEALYLLQRIRDESHRFAITYHRQLRDKAMTKSFLDDIKGLGPKRKKKLISQFGSIKAIKTASEQDLLSIDWLPESVAIAICSSRHS